MRKTRTDELRDLTQLGTAIDLVIKRIGRNREDVSDTTLMSAVFANWEKIATGDASTHTKPLRVSTEALVIAADHPAWATWIKSDSARILRTIEEISGKSPKRVEVVVRRG